MKRRLFEGREVTRVADVATFPPPAMQVWLPFTVEATADHIVFHLGDQTGQIQGPLEMGGVNTIRFSPGTKLKDVSLEILTANGRR